VGAGAETTTGTGGTTTGRETDRPPWWRRVLGVPLLVAIEALLVVVFAPANDFSSSQTALTLLVVCGGTAGASVAAWLLGREEEQAELRALAAMERRPEDGT